MAVANDSGDAGHSREFLRRALCVAAGYDDSGRGISAMRLADKGTGRTVGFGSDAACVHDNDVGSDGLAFRERPQISGNGLAVSTCRAAPKILNGETRHRFSLVNIRS